MLTTCRPVMRYPRLPLTQCLSLVLLAVRSLRRLMVSAGRDPPQTQPYLDWATATAVLEAPLFPVTEPDQSARQRRCKSMAPSTRSPSSRISRPLHVLDANNTSHKKRRTLPAKGHEDSELPISSTSGSVCQKPRFGSLKSMQEWHRRVGSNWN